MDEKEARRYHVKNTLIEVRKHKEDFPDMREVYRSPSKHLSIWAATEAPLVFVYFFTPGQIDHQYNHWMGITVREGENALADVTYVEGHDDLKNRRADTAWSEPITPRDINHLTAAELCVVHKYLREPAHDT